MVRSMVSVETISKIKNFSLCENFWHHHGSKYDLFCCYNNNDKITYFKEYKNSIILIAVDPDKLIFYNRKFTYKLNYHSD